jgi:predicted TIM-barrel fold metal-dependent hydrolase
MDAATLPPVLDGVLRRHRGAIGAAATSEAHKDLYATDARMLLAQNILQGPTAIAKRWASYSNKGFVRYVVPVSFGLQEDHGHIVGIMVETPPGASTRYARRLMHVLLKVQKGSDGTWRIIAESGTPISNPDPVEPITASSLIEQLNEAGATYGVVASLGYEFADGEETPGERARVQAENDWTVQQVAQFPGRLVTFCGLNPIRTYAIAEMDRCAAMPGVRGMKLYLANRVDLTNPVHVEKLRTFVRAANARRLPLLVHLPLDFEDGAKHARIFLEQIVPAAPDIPIQIAHLGGGGWYMKGFPDDALGVFADAAAARNPLMKNLYFDVTGSVAPQYRQPPETYELMAQRMRTVGLKRILFGTDLPVDGLEKPADAWATFRKYVPLKNAELEVIAKNVAPYAR